MISTDKALMAEIQARFEKKVREKEIESIAFWKEEVDRILALKPEGIGPIQLRIKKLSDMMNNRISVLKKGMP